MRVIKVVGILIIRDLAFPIPQPLYEFKYKVQFNSVQFYL